jgi:hypothetical protein
MTDAHRVNCSAMVALLLSTAILEIGAPIDSQYKLRRRLGSHLL